MIKLIGYWADCKDPEFWDDPNYNSQYPDPRKLVDPDWWENKDKDKVKNYLINGNECNHMRGYSNCRICGIILGSFERTDGEWLWPDRLEHYLDHDVRLPEEFITHIDTNNLPPKIEINQILPFDETFWTTWGKNNNALFKPNVRPYNELLQEELMKRRGMK